MVEKNGMLPLLTKPQSFDLSHLTPIMDKNTTICILVMAQNTFKLIWW